MKVQYIEEKLNKHTESLKKKKNQPETLETKSPLSQQTGTKIEQILKKKTKEYLGKRLKSFKRNMQKLCDSIKRPTWELQALKQEKRCKPKVQVIYSTK
jgi:hypothetical protein